MVIFHCCCYGDMHDVNKARSLLGRWFLCPPASNRVFASQIIQRRKRSEMQAEYDVVWPNPPSPVQSSQSQTQAFLEEPQDPLKTSSSLWVSVRLRTGAFCLGSQPEGCSVNAACLCHGFNPGVFRGDSEEEYVCAVSSAMQRKLTSSSHLRTF